MTTYEVKWGRVLLLTALITVFQTSINVYGTMATGWGDSGTVLSVLLAILIAQRWMGKDIHGLNLIQTGSSGGASVGFIIACMASMVIAGRQNLPLPYMYAMMFATCFLGCCVAIPLRRPMVTNSTLTYPDAVITSALLKTATGDDPVRVKRAAFVMATAGLWSVLITMLTKLQMGATALIHAVHAPATWQFMVKGKAVALTKDLGFAWSPEPLYMGIGFVIPLRIGVSLFIGGLMSMFFFVPLGVANQLDMKDSHELHKWAGIAMMMAVSFIQPILDLVKGSGAKKKETAGTQEKRNWNAIIAWSVLFVALVFVAMKVFGAQHNIPWWNVLQAVVVMWALTMVSVRATGLTNINPVRAAAMITIMVMLLFLPKELGKDPQVLLALGLLAGAGATMAGDMMVDYKCGAIIGTKPLHQTAVQFYAVAIGALVAPLVFWVVTSAFPVGGTALPTPGGQVWAGMAKMLAGGKQFSTLHWTVTGLAAGVGVLLTLLEKKPSFKRFTPSPFGLGIAMLLPFEMGSAIFVGTVVKALLAHFAKKWDEEHGYNVGIGIFGGGALAGVIVAFMIAFASLMLKKGFVSFPLWQLVE